MQAGLDQSDSDLRFAQVGIRGWVGGVCPHITVVMKIIIHISDILMLKTIFCLRDHRICFKCWILALNTRCIRLGYSFNWLFKLTLIVTQCNHFHRQRQVLLWPLRHHMLVIRRRYTEWIKLCLVLRQDRQSSQWTCCCLGKLPTWQYVFITLILTGRVVLQPCLHAHGGWQILWFMSYISKATRCHSKTKIRGKFHLNIFNNLA